jgi:hypothetical protein
VGFPVLVDVGLQIHEVEKGVRGATGRKYIRIFHIHDLEEYLLPYLDGNTLNSGHITHLVIVQSFLEVG